MRPPFAGVGFPFWIAAHVALASAAANAQTVYDNAFPNLPSGSFAAGSSSWGAMSFAYDGR